MNDKFEEVLSQLHAEVNEHLGILHSLHHKQQILNIQLVIGQIITKVQCELHHHKLEAIMDTIISNLLTTDLSTIIQEFMKFLKLQINDDCIEAIDPLKSHIRTYLKLLNKETTNFKDHVQYTDLSSVDITKAYDVIVDPLSNQKRLEIMIAIHNKHSRFKDLEEVLNLQAGHLIYHLNPLKGNNYVTQDHHKNYLLTDKGNTILKMIKYIYETFSE